MSERPIIADLIELCGLSHEEAAEFLGVHIGTIRKWSAGQRQARRPILDRLADLWLEISSVDEPRRTLPAGAMRRRLVVLTTRDRKLLVETAGLKGLSALPKTNSDHDEPEH